MSVLRPETVAVLRGARPLAPTFSSMITAELFEHRTARGRFRVLIHRDGGFIVYDPLGELGARTRAVLQTEAEAVARAQACSAEAAARGEPNEPARREWRLDWGNPRTWMPDGISRPLSSWGPGCSPAPVGDTADAPVPGVRVPFGVWESA